MGPDYTAILYMLYRADGSRFRGTGNEGNTNPLPPQNAHTPLPSRPQQEEQVSEDPVANEDGRGIVGHTPPPPGNDPESDDSDPKPEGNDPGARKRYVRNRDNNLMVKTIKMGSHSPAPHSPCLLSKKSNMLNQYKKDPDDLDCFLRQVQEVVATDMAYYTQDLDKIFMVMGQLEEKASKWYEKMHLLVNMDATTIAGVPFDPYSS